MGVVVFVTIERQRAVGPGPEERAVLRRGGYVLGRAFAADMPLRQTTRSEAAMTT
jgi:hypothetical protein